MKRMLLFAVLAAFSLTVFGQRVVVDLKDLPPDAQNAILNQKKTDEMTTKIKTYSKWAGMGEEIGTAVSSSLTAVKDVTVELSETDIGKTTIMLVVWKVLYRDILQISLGMLFFVLSTIFIIRSYFRTFRRRVLVENHGFLKKKVWKVIDHNDSYWKYPNGAAVLHWTFWIVSLGVSALIMFG